AVEVPTTTGSVAKMVSQPVTLTRTPAKVVAAAPQWGEHTEEILREVGYRPEQIQDLRAQAAI
ncbi:MAG: CoA transferase, partial [Burkholderiaceae bacterium]